MPKIQWEKLPRERWAHLRDRARERKVSETDLFELNRATLLFAPPPLPDGRGSARGREPSRDRQGAEAQLLMTFCLAEWKALDPGVPDDDWYKDFGTFKLCGTGRFPSTFLMAGQAARGKRL